VPSEPVAAAPAAAPASATPKTISGVEYVQAPRPEYPPVSRRNGEQGVVQLRVLINEHGRPERVEIATSSGSARLDEAAKKAVMRAVFKPYLENGWLLPVYVLLPIRFNLD
jgi:protein TonB